MHVKIKVFELMTSIKKWRAQHKLDYEKAIEGYFQEMLEKAQELNKIAISKDISAHFNYLNRPPENLDSKFKALLAALELSESKTVNLTPEEVDCYINGNFDWLKRWRAKSSSYLEKVGLL